MKINDGMRMRETEVEPITIFKNGNLTTVSFVMITAITKKTI